jgi:hypothetical protein
MWECRAIASWISGTVEVLAVDRLNATFWHHDVRKVILLLEKPSMRVA